MTYEEQAIRDGLDTVAGTAPPVGFGAAELIRRGRRRRRIHRGALMTGAVAALALVVTVPTIALQDSSGDRTGIAAAAPDPTRTATPTRSATPTRPATPSPAPIVPARLTVPGLTAAQADQIARSCALSGGDDPARAEVYSAVRDAAGLHALAYTPDGYLSCDVSGSPARYSAQESSGGTVVMQWLPGVFGIDSSSSAEGGTPQKDHPGGPPAPGYVLTEGRVTSAVARLSVSFGAGHLDVRPQNRTFIARLLFSTTWKPAPADVLSVTAYDAGGRVLGSYRQVPPEPCYRTPSGQVILGRTAVPTPGCKPAQRWR